METGGYLGDVARKMALIEKIGQHTKPLIGKWPEYGKASFWSMLLRLDVIDLRRILGTRNQAQTDLLHMWWGQGQFLLAPMGQPFQEKVPVSTTTESPDKPATRGAAGTRFTDVRGMEVDMPLHTDPRTLFTTLSGVREACNINTWRALDDGQVAKFQAELKENLPAYELLDLQAKLIRAWALTAAADPQEYKRFDDDDDQNLAAKYEDLRRSILAEYYLPLDGEE
ncbi:hypothetical protein CMUS01_15393 [Colletotrichum musicola]|uniref:Uncharacterized protein n=1 Tax=Colletotrichum musicola TaxID=2175873 RepID=A0A8H6IWR8_9PEZI|nr:hypothetical protein CMUS01_15393 [Colletotrichum musicola]